jgi:ribose/xylose/arabinose/galactoside ABC-type transport system permease subunit
VRRVAAQYSGVGIVLVALVTYLSITQERFATWDNASIILQQQAVLLVVAVGLTFVMLVGGIDLSMGGVLALAGVLTWKFLEWGVPVPLTIVLVTAIGFLLGALVNGLLIARLRLSFLVVTLGTGGAFTALALLITNGQTQSLLGFTGLTVIGTTRIGSLPCTVVIAVGLLVVSGLVLRFTGFGRMIYATGGNEEAARLAGIDVATVRTVVYGLAGGLAAVAGILKAAHLASADPQAGQLIVLEAAAAVLIGGTSFMGGSGTMLGTFLGVLFLGVLSNGLTRLDISAYWNGFITGAVLVFALLIDRFRFRGNR